MILALLYSVLCNICVHITQIIHELDPFFNNNFKTSMFFPNNFSENKLFLKPGKANR